VLKDAIDIALVAVLLYTAILWLREARAHLAFMGMGILGGIYLAARQLGLGLTAWMLQGFFAAFALLAVVLFQAELRQAFERLALWGMRRQGGNRSAPGALDKLVSVAFQLATRRHGALIVLPGFDLLDRHLHGGIELDGRVSEPLLLSLFDPHSPGHDGAAIVDGDRVRRFAAHLPLSADQEQIKMRGTRHAAALGLSEVCDALCIVVSEERGTVNVARAGTLRAMENAAALTAAIRSFQQQRLGRTDASRAANAAADPRARRRAALRQWAHRLRGGWRAGAAAFALSGILWLLIIPGSESAEQTLQVPVIVTNLPPGYELESVDPPAVEAVFSGLRRDFLFIDRGQLRIEIDALLVQLGRRTFKVSPELVSHPPGLRVESVAPQKLRLSVREKSEETGAGD